MTRVIFATLFCFGTLSATVWADDPAQVNDTAVRDAVSRSLPFLEKEGVAWMGCGRAGVGEFGQEAGSGPAVRP